MLVCHHCGKVFPQCECWIQRLTKCGGRRVGIKLLHNENKELKLTRPSQRNSRWHSNCFQTKRPQFVVKSRREVYVCVAGDANADAAFQPDGGHRISLADWLCLTE